PLTVSLISLLHFAQSRGEIDAAVGALELGITPSRALLHRSIEKNLNLRLWKNHRADVASFRDHAATLAHGALQFQHAGAHRLHSRHLRGHLTDFRRANVCGDIL